MHLYSCSCPDSILQHTICKHVHLVAQYKQEAHDQLPSAQDPLDNVLIATVTQKQSGNCESVQNRIMTLLNDISSLAQSSDAYDELRMTETKLITIKNSLMAPAIKVPSMLPTICEPSNKNVEKQRSFQSFKKRRASKIRFANPSLSIRKEIRARLLGEQSSEDGKGIILCAGADLGFSEWGGG